MVFKLSWFFLSLIKYKPKPVYLFIAINFSLKLLQRFWKWCLGIIVLYVTKSIFTNFVILVSGGAKSKDVRHF